jgi:hypothetical protein
MHDELPGNAHIIAPVRAGENLIEIFKPIHFGISRTEKKYVSIEKKGLPRDHQGALYFVESARHDRHLNRRSLIFMNSEKINERTQTNSRRIFSGQ